MRTVCLDFDGVMSDYHGWKGAEVLDPPRAGLQEFLASLQEGGYQMIIHTTRKPALICNWLEQNNLHCYFEANCCVNEKPPAFVYVDDRAVCFSGDYEEARAAITRFRAYWEKSDDKATVA